MATSLLVSWSGIVPFTSKYAVWATPPVSPGILQPPRSAYRLMGVAGSGLTHLDIHTAWIARFGALQAGQRIWVLVVDISTSSGMASQPSIAFADVT